MELLILLSQKDLYELFGQPNIDYSTRGIHRHGELTVKLYSDIWLWWWGEFSVPNLCIFRGQLYKPLRSIRYCK